MRVQIPFLASKYDKSSAKNVSVQNLVNFYLEEVPQDTLQQGPIAIRTPGLSEFCNVNPSGTVCRGAFQHKGTGYVVVGNTVYSVTSGGVATSLGTLGASTGRVTICATNDEIVFADGATDVRRYKVSTSNFATVSDADLPNNVKFAVAINEYVLYLKPNTGQVFVSNLSDASSIVATNFFTCESFYDDLQSAIVNKGLIYLFGDVTTEIWFNDGGAQGAPFARAAGGNLPFGIACPYAVGVVQDKVYLPAKNEQGFLGLVVVDGNNYSVIQNRDFAEKFNNFTTTSDAFFWTFSENGHHFYCITFPNAEAARGRTFGYDVTTGVWNELQSLNLTSPIGPIQDRHPANCHMSIGNKQIVGDFQSGKLYEISQANTTDNGNAIVRKIRGMHLTRKGEFFSVSNLELEIENTALDGEVQGSNPQIGLNVSKDLGHNWSNTKYRSVGNLGNYRKKVKWSSLGGGHSFTPEFVVSDPVRWVVIGATADLE